MIVPKNAKNVFRGILWDVYQWEQKMYDGSFTTFEKLIRKPSVEVVAVVDNKIIVLKEVQPGRKEYFGMPAGRVDEGEEMIAAAERELLEETGHQAEELELFAEFFGDSKIYFHEQVYIGRNCKKITEQKLDNGEKIEVEFWNFEKWLQLCRDSRSVMPFGFRMLMYEALLDEKKKRELKNKIFKK